MLTSEPQQVRIDLVKSLEQNNRELKSISEAFIRVVETPSFQIQITSFYETQAHPLTKGLVRYFSRAGNFKAVYFGADEALLHRSSIDPRRTSELGILSRSISITRTSVASLDCKMVITRRFVT